MATHRKEMDVEYFASHPRAGHGGAGSRVPSAHDQGSFTTIPPAATRYGSLDCDLYTRNTHQSHAHKVFDGRSRVSLRHGPSSMTHGSWENNMEKSSQPSRRCHGTARSRGHQVFEEMSHSCCDHKHTRDECRRVSVAAQEMYHSYGNHAHAESQSETQPRVDGSATYQVLDNMPHIHKRVLSVKIHNMAYAVTADVLYQIFSAYGEVEMVIPTTSSMVLIQYQHEQMAAKAHMLLHGRYLYQSCCQLDIRYAHAAELEMLHPSKCTVQPLLDSSNTSEEKYATVVPNPRVADKCCPQVFDHSLPTSLNQEVSTEKQQHVTLDTIITFLDEWRAEIEQGEHSRTEQAELKSELEYFLHHAFDIFEDETENELVLKLERKKKRIEQEELERELEYFLYHAFNLYDEECESEVIERYSKRHKRKQEKTSLSEQQLEAELRYVPYQDFDMFGEELESVLEEENEKRLVKHGSSTVVGLVCGADVSIKCELNLKLNHVEPRVHWEPGDQEEGNKLMKLTVDSQFLRREEMLGISILQENKNYPSGMLELSVWLDESTSCLEHSLELKLKEISFCNYMLGGGESGKPTLPWDPGEEENVLIYAKLKVGSVSAKGTRKCMLQNLLELMQSILLQHSSSLSPASANVKDTIQGILNRLQATQFNCILALLSKLHDMFMYAPITSKEAKMARTEYSVSDTTSTDPTKSEKAFTVLVVRITDSESMSRGNCSIIVQARISSNFIVLVFNCQEDNWGTSFTQALSLPETKSTCAIIAVAFMRRGVMLNCYSPHVLVPSLHFSTRACLFWTERLYGDVAFMFMEASSGILPAHSLAIDAQNAITFQRDKSITCSNKKQNQPDTDCYNQWDPGILKREYLTRMHFSYVRRKVPGNLDMYSSVGTCKVMTADSQLTCQEVTVNTDCGNLKILKCCAGREALTLKVVSTEWIATSSVGLLFHSKFQLGKVVAYIITDHQTSGALNIFCKHSLQDIIKLLALKNIAEFDYLHEKIGGSIKYLPISMKLFCLGQCTDLYSCDSSTQEHSDCCWWKLPVEMNTEWQWDPGILAPSQAVLEVNIWSEMIYLEAGRLQGTKSRLAGFIHGQGRLFMINISLWSITRVAAELTPSSLTVHNCYCCHQQFSHTSNQLCLLQPFKIYKLRYGIEVWILSFLPP